MNETMPSNNSDLRFDHGIKEMTSVIDKEVRELGGDSDCKVNNFNREAFH